MTTSTRPLRVIIAEDYELSRNGIIVSLQRKSAFQIVGEASQGDEAIEQTALLRPDIVLMDIEMPVMDGIQATRLIKQRFPDVKVLMLTSHDDKEEALAALTAGADGYCLKDIAVERLIQVMEMVHDEAVWLDPGIAKVVMANLQESRKTNLAISKADNDLLTERELEILQAIVNGLSNKEIGELLHISLHTVKVHVRNIIDKMAVTDRTQAAVKAIQKGYVELE